MAIALLVGVEQTLLLLLAERYYVTFGYCRRKSVRRLSVTLLHRGQRFELFGNLFRPSDSPGTRTLCIKIWGKKSKGF